MRLNLSFSLVLALMLSFIPALAGASEFVLRDVEDAEAVCNDGGQANYWFASNDSDKWLVQFPGGGSGWPASRFGNRDSEKKSPAQSRSGKRAIDDSAIAAQFFDRGYNVIWLHYCSSDLYGGEHVNQINGELIPFRGRSIVRSIVSEFEEDFRVAEDIVLAGTSAGAYGIVLNLDLFSAFTSKRVILDGIWRDDYQKSSQKPDWFDQEHDWVPYLLGDMPAHCQGDFYSHCWVDRSTLQAKGITRAFIIMNFGDPYNFVKDEADREGFAAAMQSDAEVFGGGFSVDAKKHRLQGAVRWGHGLITNARDYKQEVGGASLESLIGAWIDGAAPVHIHY